jgi:hypothetical protein
LQLNLDIFGSECNLGLYQVATKGSQVAAGLLVRESISHQHLPGRFGMRRCRRSRVLVVEQNAGMVFDEVGGIAIYIAAERPDGVPEKTGCQSSATILT